MDDDFYRMFGWCQLQQDLSSLITLLYEIAIAAIRNETTSEFIVRTFNEKLIAMSEGWRIAQLLCELDEEWAWALQTAGINLSDLSQYRLGRQKGNVMPNTCYDSGNFVIPSHDANGRTGRLALDVHPGQGRILDYLVSLNKHGFQTKDAVVRWCICWGTHTLLSPLPNSVALMEAKMNIFHDERFEKQKDCLSIAVQKYVAARDIESARRLVEHSLDEYSKILCEYWRARWCSTLQDSIDLLQRHGVRIATKG